VLDPITLFTDGGPFMYPALLGAIVGPIWILFWATLTAFRFRVPAAVVVLPAPVVVIIGSVGTWSGLSMAQQAVQHASPEMASVLAAAGYGVAHYLDMFAMLVASGLFALAAFALGVAGMFSAGEDAKFRLVEPPIIMGVAVLACVSSVGLGLFATALGIGEANVVGAAWVGLVAGASLFGLSAASCRWSEALLEHQQRGAANRGAVGLFAVLAVVLAGRAFWLEGKIQVFEAISRASPETKQLLVAVGELNSQGMLWVGSVAALLAVVAALVSLARVISSVGGSRTILGAALLGLLALCAVAAGALEWSAAHEVAALAEPAFRSGGPP